MRHEYKGGKTLCGTRWYRTGFAPCELGDRELPLFWDPVCSESVLQEDGTFDVCGRLRENVVHVRTQSVYSHPWRGKRLSAADMAAVAEVTGADQCAYREPDYVGDDGKRDVIIPGDVIDGLYGQKMRVTAVHDDGMIEAVSL